MNRSVDRILTTHAGSLPRPGDLLELIQAKAPLGAIFRLRLPVGAASLLRGIALNSSPNAA
jgi:hypothetical protein